MKMPLELYLGGDDPVIMGIVNVTPDSFSDGGRYLDAGRAVEHGLRLRSEGARILDIGGESTKPGADPVSISEEIDRVIPVIEGLKSCGALLSVDTRNAATMKAAIAAGAGMVNDVSALTHEPASLGIVAESGVYVCLMHMKGEPKTMQTAPSYDDAVGEVRDYLLARAAACLSVGIDKKKIILDPGIGFGKNLDHNLDILKNLGRLQSCGYPVLLGASRKRFIADLSEGHAVEKRLPGSLAACLAAWSQGIRLFRVHDVAETVQALAVYRAVTERMS